MIKGSPRFGAESPRLTNTREYRERSERRRFLRSLYCCVLFSREVYALNRDYSRAYAVLLTWAN